MSRVRRAGKIHGAEINDDDDDDGVASVASMQESTKKFPRDVGLATYRVSGKRQVAHRGRYRRMEFLRFELFDYPV